MTVVLAIECLNGSVATWSLTSTGVTREVHDGYTPTLFVGDAVRDLYGRRGGSAPSPPPRDGLSPALADLQEFLDGQEAVASLDIESHRQTFRTPSRPLLRVDATSVGAVRAVAKRVQQFDRPGEYTCYNVDVSRQLRVSLETGLDPAPDRTVRDIRTLELSIPRHESDIESLPQLTVAGDRVGSTPRAVVEAVASAVAEQDPDVLVVSTADIVARLFEAADAYGIDFELGRRPGHTKLAGESTYESYGTVGHSPARYTVPGRVVVDESNSFFSMSPD
ncbi:MAG: hypothetical protein A07HR60_00200 [uncultured archaeon A07HR60]|nr:MAG: hypothetical protein A07HR60_00200 [uncultured archaeon A07HR60]